METIAKESGHFRFKIHYKIDDYPDDFIIVEGETVEDCIKQKDIEFKKRGISDQCAWSEEIKS